MAPDLHAAWTDAVLSAAALTAVVLAYRRDRQWLVPVGLAAVGLAAAFGTVRLGGVEALKPVHEAVSRLAGLVGVPLAGLGVIGHHLTEHARGRLQVGALAIAIPLGLLAILGPDDTMRAIRDVSSGAVLVATIGFSAWHRNALGVAGPVLVLVAGLGIAGDGAWLGFPRVAWFHLVMAVAMAAFGAAGSVRASRGPPAAGRS